VPGLDDEQHMFRRFPDGGRDLSGPRQGEAARRAGA
jgi:hypothetical protein